MGKTVNIGGFPIDFPDPIELVKNIPAVKDFRSQIDQLQANLPEGDFKIPSGANQMLAVAASAASLVPPPMGGPHVGMAIAAGAKFASLIGSVFADKPVPKISKVKGIPVEELKGGLSLLGDRSGNNGAIIGKIISGDAEGVSDKDTILDSAMEQVRAVLNGRKDATRGVRYFLAYAPYKTVFDQGVHGVEERAVKLGKLLARARQEVQLREMLFAWNCYRRALAYWVYTGGRCDNKVSDTLGSFVGTGTTFPVPGLKDFAPGYNGHGSDSWPGTRYLCGRDSGVDKWIARIGSAALPVPVYIEQNNTWSYSPPDPDFVKEELRDFYTGRTSIIDLPGKDREPMEVKLPSKWNLVKLVGNQKINTLGILTDLPETWEEATAYCFRLSRVRKPHGGWVAGTSFTRNMRPTTPLYLDDWWSKIRNHQIDLEEETKAMQAAAHEDELGKLLGSMFTAAAAKAKQARAEKRAAEKARAGDLAEAKELAARKKRAKERAARQAAELKTKEQTAATVRQKTAAVTAATGLLPAAALIARILLGR